MEIVASLLEDKGRYYLRAEKHSAFNSFYLLYTSFITIIILLLNDDKLCAAVGLGVVDIDGFA